MRPLRLRTRMFVWFMALATTIIAGTATAYYFETRAALLESLDRDLVARARDVGFAVLERRAPEGAPSTTTRASARRGFEVLGLPDLSVVARSASLESLPPLLGRSRLDRVAAGRGRPLATSEEVAGLGRARICATIVRADPSDAGRVVVTCETLEELDDELREVVLGSTGTLGAAFLLSAAAAWLAVRHLTRPLRRISEAAGAVEPEAGPLVIPGSGAGDEIDDLANALGSAFDRLRESYARQARFASDAAHELRTPTAVILSQAEVAVRRERTTEQYRATLDAIAASARRMQQTLDALLLVARGDADATSLRRQSADLGEVVRATIAAIDPEATTRSVVLRSTGSSSAIVSGDARLLGVLLRNLVLNAVAYSPKDGDVTIDLADAPDAVVLTVTDHGCGIPAEALPHVFDRFFRVDDSRSRATGGSGLGLALVRHIATIHGGFVEAASTVGAGTRMTVRLPRPGIERIGHA